MVTVSTSVATSPSSTSRSSKRSSALRPFFQSFPYTIFRTKYIASTLTGIQMRSILFPSCVICRLRSIITWNRAAAPPVPPPELLYVEPVLERESPRIRIFAAVKCDVIPIEILRADIDNAVRDHHIGNSEGIDESKVS